MKILKSYLSKPSGMNPQFLDITTDTTVGRYFFMQNLELKPYLK